jgi:hypothetical protein
MRGGQGFGDVHLRSRFYALSGNIKESDRTHRSFAGAKTLGVGFPAKSQSGDDARASDDDATLSGGWCDKGELHGALFSIFIHGVTNARRSQRGRNTRCVLQVAPGEGGSLIMNS